MFFHFLSTTQDFFRQNIFLSRKPRVFADFFFTGRTRPHPDTCVDLGSYRRHPWGGPAARRGVARDRGPTKRLTLANTRPDPTPFRYLCGPWVPQTKPILRFGCRVPRAPRSRTHKMVTFDPKWKKMTKVGQNRGKSTTFISIGDDQLS